MALNLKKFEVQSWNGSFARRPTVEGGHLRVFAAATAETHTVPTDLQTNGLAQYVVFSANVDFWVTPITAAEANLTTNGTFASDTGWTKGTGWTIAAGVATATGAISTAISQTAATPLIEGRSYSVTFTTSSVSAGSVAVTLGGGTAGTSRSTSATFTETIIAGSSQTIAFTGTGFTGNIDTITVTPIAIVPTADITAGGGPDQNPTVYLLGGAYAQLSIIPTGAGTVSMQFYM